MIHPSSIVSKEVELAPDVKVGPFCVIRGKVKIGKGTVLHNHVTIGGDVGEVEIGSNNQFFAGAVIGGPPQDLKFKGETTRLVIGNNNYFRESVTVNLGTVTGGGVTKVGNHNLIMAYTHIAHDCQLGDDIAIANSSQLAGHVIIDDHVRIGGMCGFVQFTRVGTYAYIGGDSTINKDILPYCIAQGKYALCRATNKIGLERAGFSKDDVSNIHKAIRTIIMGDSTVEEALKTIESECTDSPSIQNLLNFVKKSEKGIAR